MDKSTGTFPVWTVRDILHSTHPVIFYGQVKNTECYLFELHKSIRSESRQLLIGHYTKYLKNLSNSKNNPN